jgi:hypothetical protein
METQRTFVHATGRVVELRYDADALLYTIVTYATDAAGRLPRGRALDVRYCTSPAGLPAMYAAAVTAAGEDEQVATWPAAA